MGVGAGLIIWGGGSSSDRRPTSPPKRRSEGMFGRRSATVSRMAFQAQKISVALHLAAAKEIACDLGHAGARAAEAAA